MKNKEMIIPRPDGMMEYVTVNFRIGYGSEETTLSIRTEDPDVMGKIVELFGMPGLTQCYINSKGILEEQYQRIKNL